MVDCPETKREESKKKGEIECFQCGQKGHYKNECLSYQPPGFCSICKDKPVDRMLQCGHPFCTDCISKLPSNPTKTCPACRTPIAGVVPLFL
jgi:hypothetical protein